MRNGNWKIFVIKNFCKLENRANNFQSFPGGVAQWTSHPPQEQKTRVRIPPGYKIFSRAVVYN
jgi:hypothetical protein